MSQTTSLDTDKKPPATDPDQASIDFTLLSALVTGERPEPPSAAKASLAHGWRALLKIKHVPEQLIDVTIFPVMMLLMFTYMFGGALHEDGPRGYLQGFLPGILATTIVMITMYTGIGLNVDASKGVFDRFRSLPMWRPAPIVGALLGDALRYTMAATVILTLGLIMGFRPDAGLPGMLAAVGFILVFAFSLSWLWTLLGLVMKEEKAVMNTAMMIIFPLTFLSNVFVDPETMPSWLEPAVEANPLSQLVSATRGFMHGDMETSAVMWTLLASAALVGVFGPLTMRRYRMR
jgi:ABC-2 type transport system permease protein